MMALPGGWIADRLIGQRRAVLYGGISHRRRQFRDRGPVHDAGDLLSGAVSDRLRHGAAERQRQRHRRTALPGRRRAARLGVLDFLHGDQPRRVSRAADLRLSGAEHQLAPGIRRVRLRHAARPAPVHAERPVPGRRRHAPGPCRVTGGRGARCAGRPSSSVAACSPLIAVFAVGSVMGWLSITAVQVADAGGVFLLLLVVGFFGWLYFIADWTPEERKRLYLVGVLFVAAALFWSVFEQAGSTLNLFADRNTHNVLFGWEYPEQLLPVAQLAVHLRARAGVRVAVDSPGQGARGALDRREIRDRSRLRRPRLRGAGRAGRELPRPACA